MKILTSTLLILMVTVMVAYLTLLERKVLSIMGERLGPNKVSISGILQPITDALKLMNKQMNQLTMSTYWFYYTSSNLIFSMTVMLWISIISITPSVSTKLSLMLMMAVLSVNTLKIIMASWSTFSKYPLMGMMRTISQLISYESVIYLCVMMLITQTMTYSTEEMKESKEMLGIMMTPIILYFWIPALSADLNRTPYDFSEGESELVSGFNTEFGSSMFTLIFLGEYGNIAAMSLVTSIIIITKKNINIMIMSMMIMISLIWIRSSFPRMRFDKLMESAWKIFIPQMTLLLLIYLIN